MNKLTILGFVLLLLSCKSKQPPPKTDSWILSQHLVYDYKLNKAGRVDTVFTTIYNYKNGIVFDSGVLYSVTRLQGDQPAEEIHYQRLSNNKDSVIYSASFNYNTANRVRTVSYFKKGMLLREEKTEFADSAQAKAQTNIQLRAMPSFNLADLLYFKAVPTAASMGYDTVRSTYNYDDKKRIVGIKFTDGRGVVSRTDVNLYSAGTPLASYGFGPKGDTIVRTTYKPVDANSLIITTENDSFTLLQNSKLGFILEQLTIYKKHPDKWRQVVTYNDRGFRAEERIFKSL